MITPFIIYLITRLDIILIGCTFYITIFALIFFMFMVYFATDGSFYENNYDTDEKKLSLAAKALGALGLMAVFCIIILLLVPSTENVAAMYIIPKIANNKNIQKIPMSVLNILDQMKSKNHSSIS